MIGEALEEVLDTPGPESAPDPALGALVSVGHGDVPDGEVTLLLHHLLIIICYKIKEAILAVRRAM